MEASRFGFDPSLPPAFKFDPTDADLVAYYLLPRALDLPNPHAHAIIDADPGSCPPWELLRRHGHDGSDQAFFFGPPRDVSKTGDVARVARGVPAGGDGGVRGRWRGQKGQEERLVLRPPGGGVEIVVKYKKFNLTYYNDLGDGEGEDAGKTSLSGWVMNEYQIIDPPLNPGVVLARVKIADRESKKHQRKRKKAAAAAEQTPLVPHQDQPVVPSSSYDGYHSAERSSSSAQFPDVQESNNNGGGGDDDDDVGAPVGGYTNLLLYGEGVGSFVDGNNNYVTGDNMDHGYFNQGHGGAARNSDYGGSTNSYYHGDGAAT